MMIQAETILLRRAARTRRGTSVTELAVVLPIFLIFLLGTIDFAQVMWAYGTVSEAARAGARYAMVHGSMASSPVGPTANDSTVSTIVKNNALALNTAKLTVTSSWGEASNDATCPVTVTASYQCPLSVGQLVGLSSITVTGTTTMLITH
jgi:Flp pilus assembly protein TadG